MQLNPEQIKKDITEAAERMGLEYDDLAAMIPEVIEDCLTKSQNLIGLVEAGDVTQIHAVAHDLKGVCANYGLTQQSTLAKQIEINKAAKPLAEAKELVVHFQALSQFAFES